MRCTGQSGRLYEHVMSNDAQILPHNNSYNVFSQFLKQIFKICINRCPRSVGEKINSLLKSNSKMRDVGFDLKQGCSCIVIWQQQK